MAGIFDTGIFDTGIFDHQPPVTGTLAATESGQDAFAASGGVVVSGALLATEAGQDGFAASGGVLVSGSLAGTETGTDTFIGVGGNQVAGIMAATEAGSDTASGSGQVIVAGALAATEQGQDTFAATGKAGIDGSLSAAESGEDVFTADSGRKAGGYDYKSKKRYYVRVGDRILGFATAQEATSALAKQPTTKDEADVAPSATPAKTPEDKTPAVEPPRPVEILPLAELLAYANAVAEQERVRAMLRRNEYEALARVYETWRDEEDVELLLVSL